MSDYGMFTHLEPAEALWQAIEMTNLSLATAEDLIGSAEARIGYPLRGQTRTDLLSLAEGEVLYHKEQQCGFINTIDRDEFWGELSLDEAMGQARTEIDEHLKEEAILRAKVDKNAGRMQADFQAKWMARIVADQCLGIKPIFGKGV